MIIVLIGSPGSGKGTQAELISKKFKLFWLPTGDIARTIAKTDSRISKIVNSGKLIPEEEMTGYVIKFLKKNKPDLRNILFEGFPRFITQYQDLEKYLSEHSSDIDLVISLDVTKLEAIKRISSRRICSKCGEIFNLSTNPSRREGICDKCDGTLTQREDDKPEAIATRFEYYKENTKELIDYLDKKKKLLRIDGEREVEEIFSDIEGNLEKIKNA